MFLTCLASPPCNFEIQFIYETPPGVLHMHSASSLSVINFWISNVYTVNIYVRLHIGFQLEYKVWLIK